MFDLVKNFELKAEQENIIFRNDKSKSCVKSTKEASHDVVPRDAVKDVSGLDASGRDECTAAVSESGATSEEGNIACEGVRDKFSATSQDVCETANTFSAKRSDSGAVFDPVYDLEDCSVDQSNIDVKSVDGVVDDEEKEGSVLESNDDEPVMLLNAEDEQEAKIERPPSPVKEQYSPIIRKAANMDITMPTIELGSILTDDGWLSDLMNTSYDAPMFDLAPVGLKDNKAIKQEQESPKPSATVVIPESHDDSETVSVKSSSTDIQITPETIERVPSSEEIIDAYTSSEEPTKKVTPSSSVSSDLNSVDSIEYRPAIPARNRKHEPMHEIPKNNNRITNTHVEPFLSTKGDYKGYKSTSKKKVAFGIAWQGNLEQTRSIPHDDQTQVTFDTQSTGLLFIQVTGITQVDIRICKERKLDIEVRHGDQIVCSPPITVPPNQTSVQLDWEACVSVFPDIPVDIRLRLNTSGASGLKRSLSTKSFHKPTHTSFQSLIKQQSKRLLSFTTSKAELSDSGSDEAAKSGGLFRRGTIVGSASSLSISEASKQGSGLYLQNTESMNTWQSVCTVSDAGSWTQGFQHSIREGMFYFNTKGDCKGLEYDDEFVESIVIGQLKYRSSFIPKRPFVEADLMPSSIHEVEQGINRLGIHSKVWKEGYLYQEGGDIQVSTINHV